MQLTTKFVLGITATTSATVAGAYYGPSLLCRYYRAQLKDKQKEWAHFIKETRRLPQEDFKKEFKSRISKSNAMLDELAYLRTSCEICRKKNWLPKEEDPPTLSPTK